MTPASPLALYRGKVAAGVLRADAAQLEALQRLEAIHCRLARTAGASRIARWAGRWRAAPATGLYLWGGVGRGKTFLMDLFHECLPFEGKLRLHFHRFMLRVHGDLARLRGAANPLQKVADGMAAQARVLCFDEFFVSDIGDAMILGELIGALFDRGITLVATSNVAPSRLYESGLQRRRFLPAIERIERHMEVLRFGDGEDYRLRTLADASTYHWPASRETEARLAECFHALVPDVGREGEAAGDAIEINGREIRARRRAGGVAWFDFSELCVGPRSQNDYVELARELHAVVVSGVPAFDAAQDDAARRFVSLIDEFYDRNVKLVLSGAAPVGRLYSGRRLRAEFERTCSRLQEMQSTAWLARPHRP